MAAIRLSFLLLLLISSARAELLTTKEERLGAWHYLYPLLYWPNGDPPHFRPVSTPTALAFGESRERVAVIFPGSIKVAEFRSGIFEDLQLPKQWAPLSLAVDHKGRLCCLAHRVADVIRGDDEWRKRWIIALGTSRWEKPVAIPYADCDRLEFDSQDRLWALGTHPRVGFLAGGKWTTFTYSDDRRLGFLPLRLAEDDGARVTLFAYQEHPGPQTSLSHLIGTLVYADGHFTRDPAANTLGACTAETRRYAEPVGDPGFDRAHGYVCHAAALNARNGHPQTLLRTATHVFVSLGNEGLLWADAKELATTPPLAADEWDQLDDITMPPMTDPAGNVLVGRANKLLKIGPAGTEAASGDLPTTGAFPSTVFDPLGRPWFWGRKTTIYDHGELRTYADLAAALQAEAPVFAPGRILPFAVKTPAGLLAFGGIHFDSFTIIDSRGPHEFGPREISHLPQPHDIPRHGYNPCRGGEPWYDKAGRIYTRVDGDLYAYRADRRAWSAVKESSAPHSELPPLPDEERHPYPGPFRTELETANHRRIVFHGFHFYLLTDTGERQVDTGLNPLAFYPFWSGWNSSPGMSTPCLDPSGHLWISPLGPYADLRLHHLQWYVLRDPIW